MQVKLKLTNVLFLAIMLALLQPLHAQDDCVSRCKINSNLAIVLNMPVSRTVQVAGAGWGAGGGAVNFNQRKAVIGEFFWNRMNPSGGAVRTLQTAASQSGSLSANSNLYAFTGNYRYELPGGC